MVVISLIGFMGAGKTVVGGLIAKKLGFKHLDLDHLIEERENKSIEAIFKENGEDYFRKLEKQEIRNLPFGDYVLSCGGGSVMDRENVDQLLQRNAKFVYLEADESTIIKRLKKSKVVRPLVEKGDMTAAVGRLKKSREIIYKDLAEITVYTENKDIEEVSVEIINKLRKRGIV